MSDDFDKDSQALFDNDTHMMKADLDVFLAKHDTPENAHKMMWIWEGITLIVSDMATYRGDIDLDKIIRSKPAFELELEHEFERLFKS